MENITNMNNGYLSQETFATDSSIVKWSVGKGHDYFSMALLHHDRLKKEFVYFINKAEEFFNSCLDESAKGEFCKRNAQEIYLLTDADKQITLPFKYRQHDEKLKFHETKESRDYVEKIIIFNYAALTVDRKNLI